ncbi:MAG: class I SAM-dependent methyltransferase [Lachnospiraceae bacterium]|nr:class I SAM-dependent methyltransferase [Lachnospiraceae bacterium]
MALNLQYGKDERIEKKRITFDSDAVNYDQVRPRYCPELFAEIIRKSGITPYSKVLEVGPGTGQATEPFLDFGCKVTAVELGENLADYLQKKYNARKNITVWQGDFLAYPEEERFDLIYSATAFHWIPREEGFAKVMRILKPGGMVALFWNHPIIGGEPESKINQAMQSVYAKYKEVKKASKPFDGSSCPTYEQALVDAGFESVSSQLFTGERRLCGKQYVQLMRSYSDHSLLAENKRSSLEWEMEATIREMGDELLIKDVMDLYLAKVPE